MRTLTAALTNAYGAAVQSPAWLVEIGLSSTLRLSSYATVSWDGQTWTAADVDVAALRVGALSITGSLVFGNADDSFAAIALGESFTDRRIRIWGYDGRIASPALSDPVLVCDGVGAGADVAPDRVRVAIRDACEFRIGPRAVVSPAFGFNTFMQSGRTLTINGVSFVIQRGR
jgi:hypothetical protein